MFVAQERSEHLFEYQDDRSRRLLAQAVASIKRPLSAAANGSLATALPSIDAHNSMAMMLTGSAVTGRRMDVARPDFLEKLVQYTSEELRALGLTGYVTKW